MFERSLTLLLVLGALPVSAHAQVRLGEEFQVNAYTTGMQEYPVVAADAGGNFVVVWQSEGQDGSGLGLFGRFHDASGAPLSGSEFRVNSYTPTHQAGPAVAATPDGRVVVAWESTLQDGSGSGIYARTYASSSAPPGPEIQVNTYTSGYQAAAAIAADASGNFVVVWTSQQDGGGDGIVGRRFDALGQPRGGEFLVNTYTTGTQTTPAVASDPAGNFVVAWRSAGQDGDGSGIFAQRYDASGMRVGGEFPVNGATAGSQSRAAVAADAEGNFVVTWTSATATSSDVRARRYDAAGASLGGEFLVNEYTTGTQVSTGLAVAPDGDFVVAWDSEPQDGSGSGAFARRFDALGLPEGGEFRLSSHTTGDQASPGVAAHAGGNFVTVWHSAQDGDGAGVFGQLWRADLIFRDGFEDGTLGAWSSSATDGGDLAVSTLAGLNSTTAGLRGVVDDTAGLYVQDDSPQGEDRYRVRLHFDPNGFDPGEEVGRFRTRIFIAFSEAPIRRVLTVVLRRLGGQYSIRLGARRDDNTRVDSLFVPITDAPHVIEVGLRAAAEPGGLGSVSVRLDESSTTFTMSVQNSLSRVDFVRLGALSVKPGASGAIHWDEFESRRAGPFWP